MSSSKSASSARSAIVLILTLVVVAAVLVYFSFDKQGGAESQNSIIATKRVKVDLRALYGASNSSAISSQEMVPEEKTYTDSALVTKREPIKKALVTVKKSVAKATTVKKTAVNKKKLPTPKEIKAAMPSGKKPWAINVASFSTEAPARSMAKKLYKAGYNTYVTDFVKDGVRWYRVRVGFFTSRENAIKFGKALRTELNIRSKPWPVRPHWDEISEHIVK